MLLLIRRGEPLNDSYSLTRVLEWKFKELNAKKVLDEIKEERYAEYKLLNGVRYYWLTPKGEELMKINCISAMNFLMEQYPSEVKYIEAVFKIRW